MAEPGLSDAKGMVLILNRDLFFGIRLRDLLTGAGYRVSLMPDTGAFIERLQTSAEEIVLGLIDLGAGVDWEAIQELAGEDDRLPPLLMFGPHKDVEGFRAAKGAGVTRVVSNSEFHRNTLALIQRYARNR